MAKDGNKIAQKMSHSRDFVFHAADFAFHAANFVLQGTHPP
jgi:hypothetical protein